MKFPRFLAIACVALAASLATSATAADDQLEYWFDQTATTAIDKQTTVTVETGQRFQDLEARRFDSVFGRVWLTRKLDKNFAASVAIEYRDNAASPDEFRITQQIKAKSGILRAGLRLEQRWFDATDRIGLRARPKLGIEAPLNKDKTWLAIADAEGDFDLRAVEPKLGEGLNSMKTRVGLQHKVSPRLAFRALYLRKQVFKSGYPDKVGHAPLIGIDFIF